MTDRRPARPDRPAGAPTCGGRGRAADRGHDVRLVRQPDRALPAQERRRRIGVGQSRDRDRDDPLPARADRPVRAGADDRGRRLRPEATADRGGDARPAGRSERPPRPTIASARPRPAGCSARRVVAIAVAVGIMVAMFWPQTSIADGDDQPARPRPGDARPGLGRAALLRRGLAGRPSRRGDDGHARRRRHDRRLGVQRRRHPEPGLGPRGGAPPRDLLRQLDDRPRPRPPRPLARGAGEDAGERRDPPADRPPGHVGPADRAGRRPGGRRSRTSSRATCSASGPAIALPVDGVVVDGGSAVDESMLTGRAGAGRARAPATRSSARPLNTTGTFIFRATRVGADTALARIVALVEHAQGSKAPIQRLADRISEVFVPAVLVDRGA